MILDSESSLRIYRMDLPSGDTASPWSGLSKMEMGTILCVANSKDSKVESNKVGMLLTPFDLETSIFITLQRGTHMSVLRPATVSITGFGT
jgi:hypothetical protein